VYLKELDVKTRPCDIEQLGPKTIRIILTQGLNRQIRRMCKEEGYEVVSLKRTRVIDVKLANLKPGEYRELTETEKKSLYHKCGL
jgi:23S rRNA pseudouridine2604 synthase